MEHDAKDYERIRLYLGQYTACKRRKRELQQRRAELEEEMKNPLQSNGYSAMPSGRKIGEGAASVVLMIAEIEDDILLQHEQMVKRLLEITKVIGEVPSGTRGRNILELRYIDGYRWEVICKKMYISRRQAQRDEKAALDRLLSMGWVRERVDKFIEEA